MATIIKWATIPLVAAAGVALLLSTASAGDRIVRVTLVAKDISGAQKTLLRDAVQSIWSSVTLADIKRFGCARNQSNDIVCHIKSESQGTAIEFAEAKDAADPITTIVEQESDNGVTTEWTTRQFAQPSGAQVTALADFVGDVWPGSAPATVTHLKCGKTEDAKVNCLLKELQTKTAAEMTALQQSGDGVDVGAAE